MRQMRTLVMGCGGEYTIEMLVYYLYVLFYTYRPIDLISECWNWNYLLIIYKIVRGLYKSWPNLFIGSWAHLAELFWLGFILIRGSNVCECKSVVLHVYTVQGLMYSTDTERTNKAKISIGIYILFQIRFSSSLVSCLKI